MDNKNTNLYDWLNFAFTVCLLMTALFAWRTAQRNNENIQNMVKVCDKVGLEYVAVTNFFGIRNNIIVK